MNILLIVDPQIDFISGTLAVPSNEDTEVCEEEINYLN